MLSLHYTFRSTSISYSFYFFHHVTEMSFLTFFSVYLYSAPPEDVDSGGSCLCCLLSPNPRILDNFCFLHPPRTKLSALCATSTEVRGKPLFQYDKFIITLSSTTFLFISSFPSHEGSEGVRALSKF